MAKKQDAIKRKRSSFSETENVSTIPWGRIGTSVLLFISGVLMFLGIFTSGGVIGQFLFETVAVGLFGYVGIMIPIILIYTSIALFFPEKMFPLKTDMGIGALIIVLFTGLLELIVPAGIIGGTIGNGVGSIATNLFSRAGAIIVLLLLVVVGLLILFRNSFNIIEWIQDVFKKPESDPYGAYDTDDTSDDDADEPDEASFADMDETDDAVDNVFEESITQIEQPKKDIPESTPVVAPVFANFDDFELPPLSLLSKSVGKPSVGDIRARGNIIKQTLNNFGITVEMDEVSVGPTVTRYAMKPAQGIKLTKIVGLKQDLSLALAAHPIRIEAPIPGKSLVGIEIPNVTKSSIGLGSLLEEKEYQSSPDRLLVALGKGVTGKAYFKNIGKMPHLLIAGTTGSGKSVTVHNLIVSLLYRNTPDELRFIMVDPKRVELTLYNDIPHLLTPVIKEPKKAVLALKWAAKEMERRYDLLEQYQCRDIKSYHDNVMHPAHAESDGTDTESLPEKMPYIVIIIDELADIMQAYPRELESAIVRLAQMSRATGIHLVLSTQRPSVNVITGLIKANVPSRLALQVASQIDSRTILDTPGAESLLGAGDMLYQGGDMSKPERMQAAWIPEEEIKKVVNFIKKKNPHLADHIIMSETLDDEKAIVGVNFDDDGGDNDDPLYDDARRAVIDAGKASTSYLQRKLKVGYSRAARLIDLLEENGVVGPADGSKPREVLTSSPNARHDYPQSDDADDLESDEE
jgi:DNA segregation ATPase FtsK/SpoIIIE, S-DNA-T family